MKRVSSDDYLSRLQARATKALIKFCEDHDNDVGSVAELRSCLKALERGDAKAAIDAYHRIPIGGMGCFNDWLVPVAFPHETPEYAQSVFDALLNEWIRLMRLSEQDSKQ